MRKNLAKLIALMMALVLVFSFAACGGDKDEQPSDTTNEAVVNTEDTATPGETGDTAASDETSDTAAPGESKQDDTTNKTDTPAPGGVAVPSTKDEAVKLYNDALGKVSSTKANVTRKLTKKDLTIVGDLDKLTNGEASKQFAAGGGNLAGAKLSSLSASNVSNYTKTTSGNNIVMTFTLNTTSGGTNLKHGNGGYMYFLTMDEIDSVVNQIGKSIGGDGFNVNIKKDKSSISLENGKFVVTVDKTTGKMSSAVLSFKEVIVGKCTTSLVPGLTLTADLVGEATVNYTLS